jgi:hypothetical protein
MTDQIYPPQRADSARIPPAKEQAAADEWKAQFGRLLDEYRNHYVLVRPPEEKPRL